MDNRPKPVSTQVTDEILQRCREGYYTRTQRELKNKFEREYHKMRHKRERIMEGRKTRTNGTLDDNF